MQKEQQDQIPPETIVTGSFDFQAQMGDGKVLIMHGHILDGVHASKQIDQFHDIIDRQRARSEIPKLEAEVDVLFMRLRQHKEHLEGLLKSREALSAKAKLTSTEKKNLETGSALNVQIDNMRATIGQITEEIDKGQVAIATAKKKAK